MDADVFYSILWGLFCYPNLVRAVVAAATFAWVGSGRATFVYNGYFNDVSSFTPGAELGSNNSSGRLHGWFSTWTFNNTPNIMFAAVRQTGNSSSEGGYKFVDPPGSETVVMRNPDDGPVTLSVALYLSGENTDVTPSANVGFLAGTLP